MFVALLFPSFVSFASDTSQQHAKTDVMVAGYRDADENVAMSLTFGILHTHGIMAGGAGHAGYMNVEVPPNQVNQAHKVLRNELAGLSQKQRDSFQIAWNWERGGVNALDFLGDVLQLRKFKPDMSEAEFLAILFRAKLDYKVITASGQTSYYVRPSSFVLVICGFRDRQCCCVVRIDGYDDK